MDKKIQLILVEDNQEYRNVISIAMRRTADIELVSVSGTAEQALSQLKDPAYATAIDVLLLDLHLPGMSGLEAIPWIRQYAPKVRIIVLTQSENGADVLEALQKGAVGYLLKSSTIDTIKNSIRVVVEGGASLDPHMAKFILNAVQKSPTDPENTPLLTARELEVLTLIAEGLLKKEIAHKLDLSFFTVAAHIRNIYEKLNVLNAPAAIDKAHKHGLL